jgi:hypothetical protein
MKEKGGRSNEEEPRIKERYLISTCLRSIDPRSARRSRKN